MDQNRLQEARLSRRLSQSELARISEVPQSTISSYEKGRQYTPDNLVKLAKALKVTSDYLLGLVDKPEAKN